LNLFRWAKAEALFLAWKRGRYLPPDRRTLTHEILPTLARDAEIERVLSVGVAWYTKADEAALSGKSFVTVDIDPRRASSGSSTRHVTGDVRDLERLFRADESFDAILLNGVIGYGLDTPDSVDHALGACAARLVRGGTLVIGINEEKPTHVDPISVPAHALFEPCPFGRWATGRVMIPIPFRERTHTFLFWRRRYSS
jgi:hypothetical protein